MIHINDMLLDTTVYDIVMRVKENVDLLDDVNNTDLNIMVTCPYHKGGHERKPSFGIHKRTGVCHCFTCGVSTSLPEMIGHCFGKDEKTALVFGTDWLRKEFQDFDVNERPELELNLSRNNLPHKAYAYVPDMVLDQYRYTHPYLYSRKITDEVIDIFDIGYDKETNCITMPVRDTYGNCLFVARRAVDSHWFNYPSGAEKPLYGLYEVLQHYPNAKELVVCESMFNCWTCWVHGVPAVALNGTGSKEQIESLAKIPFRSLVLALDPDDAGRHGIERIKNKVKNKILFTVDYVDGRDINDLSYEEVEELLKTKHLM